MTNADCIRSMTDEELAGFLEAESYRIIRPLFEYLGFGIERQVIFLSRLMWLKKPAEEDRQ